MSLTALSSEVSNFYLPSADSIVFQGSKTGNASLNCRR